MTTEVNEGSTAPLVVAFLDSAGAAAVPTAVRYRVDDLTNDAEIVAWTSVTPGSSVTISIAPAVNAMGAETNKKETRRVTIEASYGAADAIVDFEDYTLVNMRGL